MRARLCRLRSLPLAAALLFLAAASASAQDQDGVPPLPADAGTTITYDEAIRLALERNYQVRRTRNNVVSQSISVDQSKASYYPDLSFSAGGGRSYGRTFSQEQGGIVNQSNDRVNFNVGTGYTVFDGFSRDAQVDQAEALTRGASRTLRRERQNVTYEVLRRFVEVATNRALVDVRREQLALRRQQLEQTEAQIEVGERAASDIYQVRADVAAARQQLLQAERDTEISKTELVRLLVLDPFGSYTFDTSPVEALADQELAPVRYRLTTLLESAYDEREDLRAQFAAINASEQGVRAARAGWWPTLRLSANYGSNWNSFGTTQPIPNSAVAPEYAQITPDGGGQPISIPIPGTGSGPQQRSLTFIDQLNQRRGGSFSFSLSYPIFNRFQTRFNTEQARVELENARFNEEILRQSIAVEMRQALIDYRNARTTLEVAAEREEAARRAQEAAQERYRLGAATYVELAQANTDLAQAQSNRVGAQYDLILQQKRLAYTAGTFDPEAPLLP